MAVADVAATAAAAAMVVVVFENRVSWYSGAPRVGTAGRSSACVRRRDETHDTTHDPRCKKRFGSCGMCDWFRMPSCPRYEEGAPDGQLLQSDKKT